MDFVIDCLDEVIESSKVIRGGDLRMLGHLYILLSKLYEESKRPTDQTLQDDYIKKAITYIEMNYIHHISISDIANSLNLNRSYFSSLFKRKLQISPQNYLIQLRIDKSCDLLISNPNLTINYIATSVGYTDQLVFSKTFKKLIGMSPSLFREINSKTT
jgi:YesN/AraC family two-component response regulator